MFNPYDDEDHFAPLATPAEAIQEYARNMGPECTDRAWLLTSWDVWVRNPAYCGPPVPHPEDDEACYESERVVPYAPTVRMLDETDDIPF